MATRTYGEMALEPRVCVSAMAAIVQELLMGDRARDGRWLRERVRAADLDRREGESLEALRVRLCDEDTVWPAIGPDSVWY